MNAPVDRRTTPWRRDLAAAHLRGRIEADAYAEGVAREVWASAAPIRTGPRSDAALASEALFGEAFTVFETRDGWAWGQLATDGYVGYLPDAALGAAGPSATHRVTVSGTWVLADADIKAPALIHLSLGARLRIAEEEADFVGLVGGGYVVRRHVVPVAEYTRDFVAVAERLVGTPYLWGGRTSLGLDCSALVQLSLAAAGAAAPRDSDMQARDLGAQVAVEVPDGLGRGDLLFWKGHVAIMVDDARMVHANAHHMETVIEPVAPALDRIAAAAGPVTAVKRLAE